MGYIENAEPISDEKLEELDRWYKSFESISHKMTFCDQDYWQMRKRLMLESAELAATKEKLARAEKVVEAARNLHYDHTDSCDYDRKTQGRDICFCGRDDLLEAIKAYREVGSE